MKRSILSRVLAVLMVMALAISCMVACKPATEESKIEEESKVEKELVTITFFTHGSDSDVATKVWNYLNDYLATTDAKVKVEPHYLANSDYTTIMTSRLAAETPTDVVYSTSGMMDFQQSAGERYFKGLDELIAEYGKGILEVCPSFGLDACRVNGTLYGLPTMKEWSAVYALMWNDSVAEYLGFHDTLKNAKWNTMADMEKIFYDLKAARDADTEYGKTMKFDSYEYFNGAFTMQATQEYKDWIAANGLAGIKDAGLFNHWGGGNDLFTNVCNWWILDTLCATGIGVTVPGCPDFFAGKAANTVFNAFDTDEYTNIVKTIKKWADDKIYTDYDTTDAALGANAVALKGDKLQIMGATCGQTSVSWNAGLGGATTTLFNSDCNASQVRFATRSYIQASVMTIAFCSKNPERAMEYLNLIYTDQKLIDTFRLGIEGEHWNKNAEGRCEFVEGKGGSGGEGWYNWYGVNYGGNFLATTIPTEQSATVMDELASCSKIAAPSVAWDFDLDEISAEIAAMNNTVSTYMATLQQAQAADVDAYLATFRAQLASDGAEKVIAELQKQVNAFAK